MRVSRSPFTVIDGAIRIDYATVAFGYATIEATLVSASIWEGHIALLIDVDLHHRRQLLLGGGHGFSSFVLFLDVAGVQLVTVNWFDGFCVVLAILLFDISYDHKDSVLPPTVLLRAVCIRFNAFANWLALVPSAIVFPPVWPALDTDSFRLAVCPIASVDLPIRVLALSREEDRLIPIAFKQRAIGKSFQAEALSFTVSPVALVSRSVFHCLAAVAVGDAFDPFAFVRAPVGVLADAHA